MSDIVAARWSYRIVDDDDATGWVTEETTDLDGFDLPHPRLGATYEFMVQYVGPDGQVGEALTFTYQVPETGRQGALALPAGVAANVGIWDVDTEIEWSADTTSATISVSAGTLVIAGQTISYGASSVVVTGAAEATKTFYLYYDDPQLSGGTHELFASETYVDMRNGDGRVPIVDVTITFPATGTSTGGGGIGGGFTCPAIEAWVFERDRGFIRAGDVRAGDWLLMPGGRYGRVTFSEHRQSPGVRLVTRDGLSLRCSESAPIMTTAGYVPAVELIGRCVEIGGEPRLIESVEPLGHIVVQHIAMSEESDPCFLVGDAPGALFPHHNRKKIEDDL